MKNFKKCPECSEMVDGWDLDDGYHWDTCQSFDAKVARGVEVEVERGNPTPLLGALMGAMFG